MNAPRTIPDADGARNLDRALHESRVTELNVDVLIGGTWRPLARCTSACARAASSVDAGPPSSTLEPEPGS